RRVRVGDAGGGVELLDETGVVRRDRRAGKGRDVQVAVAGAIRQNGPARIPVADCAPLDRSVVVRGDRDRGPAVADQDHGAAGAAHTVVAAAVDERHTDGVVLV